MVVKKSTGIFRLCVSLILFLLLFRFIIPLQIAHAGIIRVPDHYSTIQAAINAAVDGDVITVGPGTYVENLLIDGKAITLTSLFSSTGDRQYIDNTIIAGSISYDPANPGEPVIQIGTENGVKIIPETTIQGLTIKHGSDGLKVFNNIKVLDNHITITKDAIDLTNSGAYIKGNRIDFNTDDAVDFDMASYGLVENNSLSENKGDGIEMRFHEYIGPTLNIVIRSNQIIHNNSDGIQLIRDWIDGEPVSNRFLTIERNMIYNNRQAGLGLMDNALTTEDYRGASLLERIHIFNNTIINNNYGLSGGDNMVVVNNIIANSREKGVSNVDGGSTLAYNLLWNNVIENVASNLDEITTIYSNPLFDVNYGLLPGSPALDSGTAHFEFSGVPVLDYPAGSYFGSAPDRGWMEMNFGNEPTPSVTPTGTNTPTSLPNCGNVHSFTPLDDATISSQNPLNNYGADVDLRADNDPIENFLLKFAVDGLGSEEILRATLRIYNVNDSSKGGDIYRVMDTTWTEETVNWSNAPAPEPVMITSLGSVAIYTWVSIDLTPVVTSEGYYTFRIATQITNAAKYASKEGVYPPYLEIEVADGASGCPNTPTATVTRTQTATCTQTRTQTPTSTRTQTATPTPTNTLTLTATPTATTTKTATSTATLTATSTKTNTPTPTPSQTPTPTQTSIPPLIFHQFLPIIISP